MKFFDFSTGEWPRPLFLDLILNGGGKVGVGSRGGVKILYVSTIHAQDFHNPIDKGEAKGS